MKHILYIIGIICIPYFFIGLLFLLSGFSFSYTETVTHEVFYLISTIFWLFAIPIYASEEM